MKTKIIAAITCALILTGCGSRAEIQGFTRKSTEALPEISVEADSSMASDESTPETTTAEETSAADEVVPETSETKKTKKKTTAAEETTTTKKSAAASASSAAAATTASAAQPAATVPAPVPTAAPEPQTTTTANIPAHVLPAPTTTAQPTTTTPAPTTTQEQPLPEEKIMKIDINGTVYTAHFADTAAAEEFKAMLPLTLDMSELNGNEKYIYLETGFTMASENVGHVSKGDIMLYGSDCIVLFYDSFNTPYSYTRLGYIDDPAGLENAVGSGSVTITFRAE